MSYLITKISQKLIAVFIAVMISLTALVSIIVYNRTVQHAEDSEINRLKGIVHTFSAQVDNVTQSENGLYSTELVKLLFDANRNNELSDGLKLVVFNRGTGSMELIGTPEAAEDISTNVTIQYLKSNLPSSPIRFGLDEMASGNEVFYAYPVAISTDGEYAGYLYVQENIQAELSFAKTILIRQVSIGLVVLILIGFLSVRSIKKILSHEAKTNKVLNENKKEVNAHLAQLETLNVVLQNCKNLILLTDKEGMIEWLNHTIEKRNNFSEKELERFVGRTLAEVSHYARINEIIEKVNRSKEEWIYETKSYDEDKNEFWASTTVTPILDENGEVVKLIFIDADITRLKQAEEEISKIASFAQENTRPLIRVGFDSTILFANEPGQNVLHQWDNKIGEKLTKLSLVKKLEALVETGNEQNINLDCDNRILNLRFDPMTEKGYVNIYGEDITELQIAQNVALNRSQELEQSKLSITDSITYARRIQEAILPSEDQVRQFFKDSFVMSMPKDIVSGDFFWVKEIVPNTEFLVALADCTGHGVPGAMMSIVGHGILNELVEKQNHTDPAEILHLLNKEIIRSLKQKSAGDNSDGMDISIVRIDLQNLEVTYAGAYQPIYWMNGKMNVLKGDRQPIGGIHHDTNRKFTNHVFKVSKGDSIYLTSDGFVDQFGGPKDKKFKSLQFEKMLQKSHQFSMQAQSYMYENEFNEWKGRQEQVDDVSMIGIKI